MTIDGVPAMVTLLANGSIAPGPAATGHSLATLASGSGTPSTGSKHGRTAGPRPTPGGPSRPHPSNPGHATQPVPVPAQPHNPAPRPPTPRPPTPRPPA